MAEDFKIIFDIALELPFYKAALALRIEKNVYISWNDTGKNNKCHIDFCLLCSYIKILQIISILGLNRLFWRLYDDMTLNAQEWPDEMNAICANCPRIFNFYIIIIIMNYYVFEKYIDKVLKITKQHVITHTYLGSISGK